MENNKSRISRLPLTQAIEQGDVRWVHDLLRHTDIDPNRKDYRGVTALQLACSTKTTNQKAIVDLLIANGADVNAGGFRTALEKACSAGNEEIVDVLLCKGAETNARSDAIYDTNPLLAAAEAGHFEILKKLLDFGADINQRSAGLYLRPPLCGAAVTRNLEMIDYLVERGAVIYGNHGSRALRAAVGRDHVDVVSRLLDLGANVNAEVDGAVPIHHVESLRMLNLLVARGAQVNEPCPRLPNGTALERAVSKGDIGLIKELLRLGADTHIPDSRARAHSLLQSAAAASKLVDTVPTT
ncbi:Ankyrin repeat-containing protein [Cladophialophora immunda]|nr:Ankyrin repeat-containing protein [Cladophialophora immunda]